MNEEQLLQEARKEAEKAIPNGTYNIDCFDECVSEIAREGFEEGYIANAKKQMSEAVEFFEWMKSSNYIKYETGYRSFWEGLEGKIFSINELYECFKQQKQEYDKRKGVL